MIIRPNVHNGTLHENAWATIRKEVAKYDGKVVAITIEKAKKKVSRNQHGFYRAVVLPLVTSFIRDFGNDVTTEEVHNWAKKEHGAHRDITLPNGEVVSNPKSMADYTTIEAKTLVDGLTQWAASFNLEIPDPSTDYNAL